MWPLRTRVPCPRHQDHPDPGVRFAMNHRGPILACLVLLLTLVAQPAAAVTIFVENIFGQVADTDGFLEGDSDPFVEIWIDGALAGTTPTAQATNLPAWPAFSCSLPITPSVGNTPLVTVELRVWDEEQPNVPPQYQGAVTFQYAWQPGLPVTASGPVVGPYPNATGLTATMRVELDAVPVAGSGWGQVKAAFR